MSLDVSLYASPSADLVESIAVFVADDGTDSQRVAIADAIRTKWGESDANEREVYTANITHNLKKMADAAGICEALWRPEEHGFHRAHDLILPLRAGLALLRSDPRRFEKDNATNGWGMYEHFVPFVAGYLAACELHPNAIVRVSR